MIVELYFYFNKILLALPLKIYKYKHIAWALLLSILVWVLAGGSRWSLTPDYTDTTFLANPPIPCITAPPSPPRQPRTQPARSSYQYPPPVPANCAPPRTSSCLDLPNWIPQLIPDCAELTNAAYGQCLNLVSNCSTLSSQTTDNRQLAQLARQATVSPGPCW